MNQVGRRTAQARRFPRRLCRVLAVLAFTLGALPAVTGVLPGRPATARADEVTADQNALRTGWDPHEPGLSPSVVSSGSFGQLFSTQLNGWIFAQPLVAGSVLIVATENDNVYGLSPKTGQVIWSRHLGTPWPTGTANCTDVGPYAGVTGTPVYDAANGNVYMVAEMVPPGGSASNPVDELIGLNAQSGQVTLTVPIQGAPVNAPTHTFVAFTELQRPALLLQNGLVYAAFGSHCDFTPYSGYVVRINVSTRAETLWTDEAGVTDDMAGIWQSGGGLMSDGSGRVFFTSGNGVSPAPGPGTSPPPELAESVVRLGTPSGGGLAAQDFFSPANAPNLDAYDADLGSGGPVGIPEGTAAYPHLLVQAGKDGRVFILNRDKLGGRKQGPGGSDAYLAEIGRFNGQWGHPAVFEASTSPLPAGSSGLNDYIYYLGSKDYLRALRIGANASGVPSVSDVANSTSTFGYSSGSPVVTSNGPAASSAVVWAVSADDRTGTNGTLHAFAAVPRKVNGIMQLAQIWSAPIGTAGKFTIPATSNGRVYVTTRDGHVTGFGSPDSVPVTGASPLSFQAPAGGTPQTQTTTITATSAISVSQPALTAAGSANPFSQGQATYTPAGGSGSPVTSFPVSLSPGDQLSVPVTFSPQAPGSTTGALTFTATGNGGVGYPPVNVSLTGDGTEDGLFADPASLAFGGTTPVPVGATVPLTVNVVNYGTTAATITSVTPPSGVFSASGLPAAGSSIQPGQSVPVTVYYAPSAPTTSAADQGSITIDSTTGNLVLPISGSAVAGVSAMTASHPAVNFGSVPMGHQARATIAITNTGNLAATVGSTSTPDAPFGIPAPVTYGLPVNPGYDLQIPVTFTPSGLGAVTWNYRLNWTDTQGTHSLTVPVTGTGAPAASGSAAIPPPGGGWTLNGSAQMARANLRLTPAAQNDAGSAVYPVPVPSSGLTASFTAHLGGGTGGDGMTLSLLDPSSSSTRSLGGSDWMLGYGGLSGVAVVLGTVQSTGNPSSNFIGIATGTTGSALSYAQTSTSIPALRQGSHMVGVTVSGGTITVTLDGKRYLSAAVSLPSHVMVAFTGATGTGTDFQTVSNAVITAGGNPLPPPGGGWSFNAHAAMTHSDSRLTPAVASVAGTVVYRTPVATARLKVVCDVQLGAGDGFTLALLNPATESPTAVGGPGGDLGFGRLNGLALALATRKDPGFPSYNFAGISTGADSAGQNLVFQHVAQAIPPLRSGTHRLAISVSTSHVLSVSLDGEQIFRVAEPSLPSTALLAFTSANGATAGVHTVRDVAISAG